MKDMKNKTVKRIKVKIIVILAFIGFFQKVGLSKDSEQYIPKTCMEVHTQKDQNDFYDAVSLYNQLNAFRSSQGLTALTWDPKLSCGACIRAKECSTLLSHTRPDGSAWWTVNPDCAYGENLAAYYPTVESAMQEWVRSPSHLDMMLSPKFMRIGIGIYTDTSGKKFYCQHFGF